MSEVGTVGYNLPAIVMWMEAAPCQDETMRGGSWVGLTLIHLRQAVSHVGKPLE